AGRQLDRAVQLDAFGLDAAGGKMAAGHLRVFGGDPDMTPAARILLTDLVCGCRHSHPAMADIEVERRVDLRIIEFHQDIVAGDAELSGAESDKGRDIEAADADQVEPRRGRGETQLARARVGEGWF